MDVTYFSIEYVCIICYLSIKNGYDVFYNEVLKIKVVENYEMHIFPI
jgi:hypothetical protein